jgi:DNA-directed RNA polymerase specialized sigma subunit
MKRFQGLLNQPLISKLERLLFNLRYGNNITIEDIKQEAFLIILENKKKYRKTYGSYAEFILSLVKSKLITYINNNTETLTGEDIGVTKPTLHIDYKICNKYIEFFNTLTALEQYIIVEYFFYEVPIYKIANTLSTAPKRVSNIIQTYSNYVKKEMK